MKKVISTFRSLLGPLADILSILGFMGLSMSSIKFREVPGYLYLVIVPIFFFFLHRLIQKISEVSDDYKDLKVKSDFERIVEQTSVRKIKLALPRTSTVVRLYKKVKKRINEWSDDAVIRSVNLYIEYKNNNWQEPQLQVIAYSDWKKEEGWFYEGGLIGEDFQDIVTTDANQNILDSNLFFYINPNWQKIVEKSFNAISTRVVDKCHIQIRSDGIRLEYQEGKLKRVLKYVASDNFSKITKTIE